MGLDTFVSFLGIYHTTPQNDKPTSMTEDQKELMNIEIKESYNLED